MDSCAFYLDQLKVSAAEAMGILCRHHANLLFLFLTPRPAKLPLAHTKMLQTILLLAPSNHVTPIFITITITILNEFSILVITRSDSEATKGGSTVDSLCFA
jgi:hypothetical protein